MTEFDTKTGKESYFQYYFRVSVWNYWIGWQLIFNFSPFQSIQRYSIEIKDRKQPLLLSFTKTQKKQGERECIGLIPELCRLTGVTEEMRTNFRLMRAVSDYTRLDPRERIKKLSAFNSRLNRCHESVAIFKEWGMEMERNIVSVKARVLSPEVIIFGNNTSFDANADADWVIFPFNPFFLPTLPTLNTLFPPRLDTWKPARCINTWIWPTGLWFIPLTVK